MKLKEKTSRVNRFSSCQGIRKCASVVGAKALKEVMLVELTLLTFSEYQRKRTNSVFFITECGGNAGVCHQPVTGCPYACAMK